MNDMNDEPPGYDDAVGAAPDAELTSSIGMDFPGCTGFIDADSWGHPSPWTRKFDFKLHITADMASAAADDDASAAFNYAQLSNMVDDSLRDATRIAPSDRPGRPYHLNAYAWHAQLSDYMVHSCPPAQSVTMESTFPIARAGADATVTYKTEIVQFPQPPTLSHLHDHVATMTITNIRALAGFGHKVRDQEMRQTILISLRLRLILPHPRSELNRRMPGGAHNLTEAVVNRVNAQSHFQTINKLAAVVRNIVNDELARHACDDQLRPLSGDLYTETGIPPHPFRIDVPARLMWLKIEAPAHLDTSTVSVELDCESVGRDTARTSPHESIEPLRALPAVETRAATCEQVSNDPHLSYSKPLNYRPQPDRESSSVESPIARAITAVSRWWNNPERMNAGGRNIV